MLNNFGQPVEEFEIQFINGAEVGAVLAETRGLIQATFARFIEIVDDGSDEEKLPFVIVVGEYRTPRIALPFRVLQRSNDNSV